MTSIPVIVLTGYLGAGKTTLLNRILSEPHGKKYAVIINEYGEEGIDGNLVVAADEEVFEMNNGCLCCTVRGDLIRVISGLFKRAHKLDGILIETTGLADPGPVAQTFFADADIAAKTQLDSIITIVDAKHLPLRLKDSKEAEEQIAFADIIILNKMDLVNDEEIKQIESSIRRINRFAKLIHTTKCQVKLEEILGQGSFNLKEILNHKSNFLEARPHEDHACDATCDHDHDHTPPEDHVHDTTISSLSLVASKPLDPAKFESWIGHVRNTKGADLLRYKGILDIVGHDNRLVIQGVHMMMDNDNSLPWNKDEARKSRLVFIGRHLDENDLRDGFARCVA